MEPHKQSKSFYKKDVKKKIKVKRKQINPGIDINRQSKLLPSGVVSGKDGWFPGFSPQSL